MTQGSGKNKPLSIRATLWVAIALTITSTLLGASALHGYQLYQRAEAAETMRIRTLAETYASQAAVWLAQSRESLTDGINHLQWHPDVCLLAVVGGIEQPGANSKSAGSQSPQIVTVRGDVRLVDQFLKNPEAVSNGIQRLVIPPPPGSRQTAWSQLCLASAPLQLPGSDRPMATLICGGRSAHRYTLSPQEILVFSGRLLLMAGCGALMGFWWLKRSVVEPLIQLTERTASRTPAGAGANRHADRDDEIGDLARALSEMHMSLEEWRDRANRLERSVNQRVATETQRVSRELVQAKRTIWADALTHLGNRRMLEDRLDEIFSVQWKEGKDLSIVMIDVDNFKELNDAKGHSAGDELLRFLGELLKQSLREQDLAIRYGGDEFILILPSVTQRDAERIAQRTILLFNQQVKLLSIQHKPSLSAGIASLWEHKVETAKELMEVADQALYQAKRAGKSCVRTIQAQPRKQVLVGSR